MPSDFRGENSIPRHVAVIMDGNGRWAQKRGLPRTAGHKEGLETAKRIVRAASDLGISYITLYTFSTENWKRAQEEVGYLMGLIKGHLRAEFEFYKENKIRIEHIGNLSGLPRDVQEEILNAKKDTADFSGTTVVLAINYGGRDEIVRAARKLLESPVASQGKILSEEDFCAAFDMPSLPEVDLLVRTGGEMRLSNFMLWHAAYAELFFTDTLWPDYGVEEFENCVKEFSARNRRFGGVNSPGDAK